MTCPLCGSEASYQGLTVTHCTNRECENWVEEVNISGGKALPQPEAEFGIYVGETSNTFSGNTITGLKDMTPEHDNGSPDPDTKVAMELDTSKYERSFWDGGRGTTKRLSKEEIETWVLAQRNALYRLERGFDKVLRVPFEAKFGPCDGGRRLTLEEMAWLNEETLKLLEAAWLVSAPSSTPNSWNSGSG